MKKGKFFILLLILISYFGLTSCISFDTNITSSIKSNIYRGSLNSSGTITTYFLKNKGDVPYIDFIDVTSSLLDRNNTNQSKSSDGYKLSRKDNGAYVLINADNDTITFSNYEAFVAKDSLINSFNPKSSTYKYTSLIKVEQTETKEVTFDLASYDIDLFESKDVLYVPFQIFDTLIYSALDISLSFNGHDYYYVSDSSYFYNNKYKEAYFSGRKQSGKRSDYMASFTYNHLMFALDNFFGIKETRGISNFDELCETNGLKDDLLSNSSEDFNKALNNLIYSYMDDGHSSFEISSNYLTYDAVADAKYADKYTGARRKALSDEHDKLSILRQSKRSGSIFTPKDYIYRDDNYAISGNTLIITYDSFKFPTVDYYKEAPNNRTKADDSFALLWYAINRIIPSFESSYNMKITNIVIDVTLNGGGYVDDCLGMIGFISNNYSVEYLNSASKDISKSYLSVDTNLDGVFDDNDSFKNEYDFYIMTSNYSFSCANMLASVCKEQGLATIIGQETGGGGAIVYNLCLGDSTSINMSGPHSLIYRDSDNNYYYSENKIKPDYELSIDKFYSPSAVDAFIKTINI